ncbi:MAG: hypothetical protein KKD73_00035 [Proteobacteria bacterium]|nr:hypothetical protein [Pseudomonadota bacterium]MBU1639070.1 hypothetical protein [Pseudomonadota bacterium]
MKRLLVFFVLLLFVAPVQAKNEKHKAKDAPVPSVHEAAEKPFGFLPPPPPPLPGMSRESQQEVIDRYFRNSQQEHKQYRHADDGALKEGKKKKHLPPGLMKQEARGKELPPGWQKKIARGEVLDHDLRAHCREVPRDLSRELPPPPKGTKFLQLEDKIIRVVEATFEIVDVFTFGR